MAVVANLWNHGLCNVNVYGTIRLQTKTLAGLISDVKCMQNSKLHLPAFDLLHLSGDGSLVDTKDST